MSDLWIRKMKTHFKQLDFDSDGVISRADFEDMPKRLGLLENIDPAVTEISRKLLSDLFTRYTCAAGTTDALMTEDLMIESIKLQRDDPEFRKNISDMLLSLFTKFDVNKDGFLCYEEHRRLADHLGFTDSDFTKGAFDAIDANHDGFISFEEFLKAANDYTCSDDEGSTAFFGLLF